MLFSCLENKMHIDEFILIENNNFYFYDIFGYYGCFSNYYLINFELDGYIWKSSEHYFQAQKFINTEYFEMIRQTNTAKEAAKIGRNRDLPIIKNWDNIRISIMKKALLAKFQQNIFIQQKLLETNDMNLIENAPRDYFWACGLDRTGENQFGKLLMIVRNTIKEDVNKRVNCDE
jgi:ribA/ribD-fused uncharacterized protein